MNKLLHSVLVFFFMTTPLLAVEISQPATPQGRFGIWLLGDEAFTDDIVDAGMSYMIKQYRWEQIEPTQDVFRFQEIDQWYENVLEPHDLAGVLIIRTGQSWATDNSYDPELGQEINELASAPPLDYDDYYDLVHTLARYFEGRIDIFIIENDPVTLVSWYGTPEEYIELSGVAYQAIKDANPRSIVIANKLPAMGFGYLIARDLYDAGQTQEALDFWNGYYSRRAEQFQVDSLAELRSWLQSDFGLWVVNFVNVIMTPEQAQHLDAIGFNYYLHYDYIDEVVEWMRTKMEENGFYRPLLDLEHGVKDERLVVSDLTASEELVKGYMIMQSLDIGYISWYPFTIDTVSHNSEYLKPMYDFQASSYLPAYFAMKTLSDHFTRLHAFEGVEAPSYVRYSFRNLETERTDLEVLWNDAGNMTVELPFPTFAHLAVVTDHLGTVEQIAYNDGGSLSLEVGAAPRFIQWKRLGVTKHENPDPF